MPSIRGCEDARADERYASIENTQTVDTRTYPRAYPSSHQHRRHHSSTSSTSSLYAIRRQAMARVAASSSTTSKQFSWATPHIEIQWKTSWDARYLAFKNNMLPPLLGDGIPKTLHFIWLGSPFPTKRFQRYMDSWKKHHAGWDIILWDDARVRALRDANELKNHKAFDVATNYGEKSDILRYELLFRHGGVYADVDFECIRSFDELLSHPVDFFIGVSNTKTLELNNGLIGSVPGHPLLLELIEGICIDPMATVAALVGQPIPSSFMSTIERTGPGHVTRKTMALWDNLPNTVAFPIRYFYPVPNTIAASVENVSQYLTHGNETYAAHRWCKSWQVTPA